MDMGFAVIGPLARHRRPLIRFCSSARFFAPRFFQASPRGECYFTLRFANPSPPSGWVEDLHLQAVKHARHTKDRGGSRSPGPSYLPLHTCPRHIVNTTRNSAFPLCILS